MWIISSFILDFQSFNKLNISENRTKCPESEVFRILGFYCIWKYIYSTFNPSHAAIKISINATAAEFICKNIFPIPVQIKKIIKNKTGDIQQIYLYQNVCK